MESSDAWVFRSTSVSSMRRIMVPPLWRAYSQLKINVLALPMWRYPVGEGAKRTRSMNSLQDNSMGTNYCPDASAPIDRKADRIYRGGWHETDMGNLDRSSDGDYAGVRATVAIL